MLPVLYLPLLSLLVCVHTVYTSKIEKLGETKIAQCIDIDQCLYKLYKLNIILNFH